MDEKLYKMHQRIFLFRTFFIIPERMYFILRRRFLTNRTSTTFHTTDFVNIHSDNTNKLALSGRKAITLQAHTRWIFKRYFDNLSIYLQLNEFRYF